MTSKRTPCPYCNRSYVDIENHIHNIHKTESIREDSKDPEIPEQIQTTQQKVDIFEEMRVKRRLSALEDNQLLAIQIENKHMRDELAGIVPQSTGEKKSEFGLFQDFISLQNTFSESQDKREKDLTAKILKNLESTGEAEPESMENIFLKTLSDAIARDPTLIMKKNPNPNPNLPTPTPSSVSNNMPVQELTDKQIIDKIPEYVKKGIKAGEVTFAQMKQELMNEAAKRGIVATADDIKRANKIFNKVKKEK